MTRGGRTMGCAAAALLAAQLLGCGADASPNTVDIPALSLTMSLPPGWRADRRNPRFFVASANGDDLSGMVEDYDLEGKSLSDYVAASSGLPATAALPYPPAGEQGGGFRTVFLARTHRTLGGLEAIELVSEGAYRVIEVNIQKGPRVIRVSFRAPKETYAQHEQAFRAAVDSVHVK